MPADKPTPFHPRLPFLAFLFGYAVLVKMMPYILQHAGMRIDEQIVAMLLYPWNFSPMYAICLFSGACFARRDLALVLPLLAMLLSDLGIWAVSGRLDWAFYGKQQWIVYGCWAMLVTYGFLLRGNLGTKRLVLTGLVGCLSFFFVTNFAVWLFGTTYPKTPAGLLLCFELALPFLRYSLLSTAVYGAVLFSPYCLRLAASSPVRKREVAVVS